MIVEEDSDDPDHLQVIEPPQVMKGDYLTQKKIFQEALTPEEEFNQRQKIDEIIALLQTQTDDCGDFFYLNPGIETDPYDLQPKIELDKKDKKQMKQGKGPAGQDEKKLEKFYTVSKKGITTYIANEPTEYIQLNDWLHDRLNFRQIRELEFFKQFRRWKIVRNWKSKVNQTKRNNATESLKEKLFILDPVLGNVLSKHKEICFRMQELRFVDLQHRDPQILPDFTKIQSGQRSKVENTIENFSRESRKNFEDGISTILEELKEKQSENLVEGKLEEYNKQPKKDGDD